ncbi:MAG TPA: phospho-N-acetylmuramoyl-pentapeptide-transferase [Deltaproteobacteria bacterium]|nr:phospho-N-acetylmuramoyl-pentapeptide-transferase [Deltaproteobacteria bacterium]HOM28904.1 phospho-N-acetylmuramoyl-pentapeptide-transferase [Deltaproteobacteria bacterium]HPP80165.1 phospho-N-acetylmuramoyl-pentapeptide-transferase [Deltaproteobacteria bacterium]
MLYLLLYPLHTTFTAFNVFKYITFRTIYATITALLITLLLGPWFMEQMTKLSLRERINGHTPKTHKEKSGTPTMGGILIASAIVVSTLLWVNPSSIYVWLGLAVLVSYALLGFIDDYIKTVKGNMRGLPGKLRLAIEFAVAAAVGVALVSTAGFDDTIAIPFFKRVRLDLGPLYVPFVMFVIVGTANAVNLTDGLDGLAIGPCTIAAATYIAFAYVTGNFKAATYLQVPFIPGVGELSVFLGALVGAGMGFLWYNTYPAQMFMGDVGSLGLGGILGAVAVMTKQEMLMLIVGGVFFLEVVSVILQVGFFKVTNGKRIFRMAPIHHHFELKGWPEPKIIVRFWIISIFLAMVAISTLKLR